MSRYSSSNSGSGGMGFLGVLQLIFIVLKLCKVITWSWWLVLIPLWIELVVLIIALAFVWWINR